MNEILIDGRKYFVDPGGDIFRGNGKHLTKYLNKKGYEYVLVKTGQTRKKYLVHRLVASAFFSEPEVTMQVNHKDGNKRNNRIENLEWATASENQTHSRYCLGNITGFADAPVMCVETGIKYISTRAAWRATGAGYSHISECARGLRKTAGGYHWKGGNDEISR